MNWKPIAGDWPRFKSAVQAQWGRLTPADIDSVAGDRLALIVKIRSVYGISQQQAENQVASWARRAALAAAP